MMKLYAVRDVKAECYGAPMSIAARGLALRAFEDSCADPKSNLARFPADYSMYEIGTYDPASGQIVSYPTPELIITASAVVLKLQTQPQEAN